MFIFLFQKDRFINIKNRKNIDSINIPYDKKVILVHACSVGEVVAVKPLIDYLICNYTDYNIVLSTVTDTGKKMAKKTFGKKVYHVYFPLDFYKSCKFFLKKLNPYLILMTETEIWPNFLERAHKMCIPVFLVNGRISPHSFKNYFLFKRMFSKTFKFYEKIFVQTLEDAEKIKKIGAPEEKINIMGNLKFEDMLKPLEQEKYNKFVYEMAIPRNRKIIIAGSTHEGEEKIFISSFLKLKGVFPELSIVIAPRHIERIPSIIELLNKTSLNYIKKTEINKSVPNKYDVVLLDTIGELQYAYSIADMAFIGGSMVPVGGHNLLEALKFGIPVFYGPYMFNFAYIKKEAEKFKCGFLVENENELYEKIKFFFENEEEYLNIDKNAYKMINSNKGVLKRLLKELKEYL
ncbi:MAG: 3-deoxy-D-manno-octulosonic acid transferase [Candidatus Muiribacteriota bacterium]